MMIYNQRFMLCPFTKYNLQDLRRVFLQQDIAPLVGSPTLKGEKPPITFLKQQANNPQKYLYFLSICNSKTRWVEGFISVGAGPGYPVQFGLLPSRRGQGLATSVLTTLLRGMPPGHPPYVTALCPKGNPAARQVLTRAGFTFTYTVSPSGQNPVQVFQYNRVPGQPVYTGYNQLL